MAEPGGAFRSALSDFTFEAACGAAIRHLADSGCSARQIAERLDYPIPFERVQKTLLRHLRDTNVILENSPGEGLPEKKPEYVMEYDSYGKPSYRRKAAYAGGEDKHIVWKESVYGGSEGVSARERERKLSALLWGKCQENGKEPAYISCDFGLKAVDMAKETEGLDGKKREYLEGIPWPCKRVWHRLDNRMRETVCALYGRGQYKGECYFIGLAEKLIIE